MVAGMGGEPRGTFSEALPTLREQCSGFFDDRALTPPTESMYGPEVIDVRIPQPKDFEQQTEPFDPELEMLGEWDDDEHPWWEPDSENPGFENNNNPKAREEREGYEQGATRVGVEALAIYLPFHLYPESHWGVRFFERPMVRFTRRIRHLCHAFRHPVSMSRALQYAIYHVAHHEFFHYLAELEAFDLEQRHNGPSYIPYTDMIYKKVYPGPGCLEETIASVWSWDNSVIRQPARLRNVLLQVIQDVPYPAYSQGANYNRNTVGPEEDKLIAQIEKLTPSPSAPPVVSGLLPRPYVLPWTRYENVPWTMDFGFGGVLRPILQDPKAKVPRKTIRIFHR